MHMKQFSPGFFTLNLIKSRLREYIRLFKPVVSDPDLSLADSAYLSVSSLISHSLFSLLCFSFSFFLVIIFQNILQGLLLYLNGIHFRISLFQIYYLPGDVNIWTEGALLLTYTLPYFLLLFAGIFLGEKTSKLKSSSWQLRLLLTWMAFNLIVFFIMNLFKATLYYRDLGIALQWVLDSLYLCIALVVLITAFLIWYIRRFAYFFLKTLPTRVFLSSNQLMKTWLLWIVVLPVLTGIIYAGLVWYPSMRLNTALTALAFIIILPVVMGSVELLQGVRLHKANKLLPSFVFIISALFILWVVMKMLSGFSFIIN